MTGPNVLLFEKLMTAKEVGLKIGVHTKTVYAWAKLRRIPHLRLGRSLRFKPLDIDEWLRKNGGHYGKRTFYP